MRRIAVVTFGRSDYGILRPLLRKLQQSPECDLLLIAGGMHFHDRQGASIRAIASDGIAVNAEVRIADTSTEDSGMEGAFMEGLRGMSEAYDRLKPDLVVLLGDRVEMFAAAAAAVFKKKPIAHLHGGELTLGAIDDVMRHSITKMSHLHFASTECYAARVVQMGEEPWRVHVSGAMALDNLKDMKLLSPSELQQQLGLEFEGKPLVVTFHPPTLENLDLNVFAGDLVDALVATNRTVVVTAPNADPGGDLLHRKFMEAARVHPDIHFIENLGMQYYFSLMKCAAAMIGNSSSGILESASFGIPVVNIGSRQEGRLQPANVINCGNSRLELNEAIEKALSKAFCDSLGTLVNPYGLGNTAERISKVLLETNIDERLLRKKFFDITEASTYTARGAHE